MADLLYASDAPMLADVVSGGVVVGALGNSPSTVGKGAQIAPVIYALEGTPPWSETVNIPKWAWIAAVAVAVYWMAKD